MPEQAPEHHPTLDKRALLRKAALEYHEFPKPGKITIAATKERATGEVVIEIRDTGQGIAERDLARIFDPFFTTKEVGVGTGLGLSVVYGILQQHHGTITVQSRPGQGTSFFIRLPIPVEEKPDQPTTP